MKPALAFFPWLLAYSAYGQASASQVIKFRPVFKDNIARLVISRDDAKTYGGSLRGPFYNVKGEPLTPGCYLLIVADGNTFTACMLRIYKDENSRTMGDYSTGCGGYSEESIELGATGYPVRNSFPGPDDDNPSSHIISHEDISRL